MTLQIKRFFTQLCASILYNANFFTKTSEQLKNYCVPGYNCRFCAGAVSGCPIATLAKWFGSGFKAIPFYVIAGFLLISLMLGRIVCGWLCPVGLVQELLYKLPTPKLNKNKWTERLSYLKYFVFAIFVVIIPIYMSMMYGKGAHVICRSFCPIPVPLAFANLATINFSFFTTPRVIFAAVIFGSAIFCYRSFCRFICPLGAWYSLFSKISVFAIKVDKSQCIGCNKCVRTCLLDVKEVGDKECIGCGKCKAQCPKNCISYGLRYKK